MKLGNNARITVLGKGNVRLKVNNDIHVVIEVFYVPKLKNSLLSIGQLQERGLAILIQHGRCKIYHRGKDSSDANIVHHTAMRSTCFGLEGCWCLALFIPISGKDPIGIEKTDNFWGVDVCLPFKKMVR